MMTGKLSFLLAAYDQANDTANFQLIDSSNKVILKMSKRYIDVNNIQLIINNQVAGSASAVQWRDLSNVNNSIKLLKNNTGLFITLGTFNYTITQPLDSGANMNNPASIKLYFFTEGNREFGINLGNIKFETI